MSIELQEDDDVGDNRFFTSDDERTSKDNIHIDPSNLGIGDDDDEVDSDVGDQKCVTLRVLQKCLPWFKARGVWEPSQGDLFKLDEVEEVKYPKILKIVEHVAFDIVFVLTSLLSVILLLFSEGFILEWPVMWGVIHCNNFIYTLCVFGIWLEILVKSKYAKTNQEFSNWDVTFTLISVVPIDIIILIVHILNNTENDVDVGTPQAVMKIDPLSISWITASRLVYFIRLRIVFYYFAKWEDQLAFGDLKMFSLFTLKTLLYGFFLMHLLACWWHWIACDQFTMSHFKLRPIEATVLLCKEKSWVIKLLHEDSPMFRHDSDNWNVLLEHYLVSMYWSIITVFRLGSADITASLTSDVEVAFTAVTQIVSWIFIAVYVGGSLTSILVERDAEKQHFLTRRFAIDKYLEFSNIAQGLRDGVNRFYDYYYLRSRGINNSGLVELMPLTMRAEIYYDVNKFVLDQLPLFANLEEVFLMNVSTHMKHNFYLGGEILQQRNKNGTAMFYVINGYLEILDDDDQQVIGEIKNGSAIGELFLLQSFPVVATVRCGSECDIIVLRKSDFKTVLNMYPEFIPTLQNRIDTRLEQSGLLLALCEKHNEYPKAFQKLRKIRQPEREFQEINESVPGVLDANTLRDLKPDIRNSDDYDGLTIDPEIRSKLARASIAERENIRRVSVKEAIAAACLAIEADVLRAGSLAHDLNIARPPLIIKAPSMYQHTNRIGIGSPLIQLTIPKILLKRYNFKADFMILWKIITFLSILLVGWFYTYQIAFQDKSLEFLDYVGHVFDFIFLIDFIIDNLQPVELLHNRLESTRDILKYRVKRIYFYVRLFSFLPIEYGLAPIIYRSNNTSSGFRGEHYYALKLNRLLQIRESFRIFDMFEKFYKVAPQLVFALRFCVRLFFIIHIFAVTFEVVLRSNERKPHTFIPILDQPTERYYEFLYYWAIEALTATGYGDFPLRADYEIATTVVGLFIGTTMIIYLNARLAAIMVNVESRRVTFKYSFYGLIAFMKERQFTKKLNRRVRRYYKLLWRVHEGVLTPTEKSPIWDAPKSILNSISMTRAQTYVKRIPLFMYCHDSVIIEVCCALKQYFVPPHEILLHPNDQIRDLYIIVKGHCRVLDDHGNVVGKLCEGNYFGINGLVYGSNKAYQIETINYCQFFCLDFKTFAEITKRHSKFMFEYKLLRGDVAFPKYIDTNIKPANWEIFRKEYLKNTLVETESTTNRDNLTKPSPEPAENANVDRNGGPKSRIQKLKSNFFISMKRHLVKIGSIKSIKDQLLYDAIKPYGYFLRYWTVFRLLSAFVVGNFAFIQFSFSVKPTTSLFVIFFFDLIAWIDLYLCFRIGYYGEENQLITHFSKTSQHYMKGPFLLDLIGCFPVDLLIIICNPKIIILGSEPTYDDMYHIISGFRVVRILQSYRLIVVGKLLQKQILKSLTCLILVQVVPLMCLFLNIMTCLSVTVACGASINGEPIKCPTKAWILNGEFYKNAPVSPKNVMKDPFESYIIAFYWVITSAMSVGFGDLNVKLNATSRKIAIAVIFFGTVVTGYLVSKLTACLVGEDFRRTKIREKTNVMFRYLKQNKVPKDLRRRVKEYYCSALDQTQGMFLKDMFNELLPALKSDALRGLYAERLKMSPIFQDLDPPGMRILSSNLHEMFLPEGEYLFQYGDMNADAYFIAKGFIATYTEHGDIISYVGPGSLLGEISCLFDIQRLFTAVCATDVQVYTFKKEDFLDFLNLYPTIKKILEEVCLQHYKETMEAVALSVGLKVITPIGSNYENSDNPEGEFIHLVERVRDMTNDIGQGVRGLESTSYTDTALDIENKQGLTMATLELSTSKKVSKTDAEKNPDFVSDPLRPPVHRGFTMDYDKRNLSYKGKYPKKRIMRYFFTHGKIPRDEMGLVHVVQDKPSIGKIVLHPMSPLFQAVSIYLFITSLSCGLTAYEIAFFTDTYGESKGLMAFRIILEIFFICRIIGHFITGYYDERGVVVTNLRLIIKRYMISPSGFMLDFITTFPFYLITHFSGRNHILVADVRGLQLFRVFIFAQYLNATETELKMRLSLLKLVKMTILLCFIFHFCSCAWYLIACDGMTCTNGSWISILIKHTQEKKDIKTENEIQIESRYLISLYYVTTAITFTGLAEITPRTQIEILCTIAMIFVTVFVIGFLVGEMSQCFASQVSSKIHYRHKINIMEQHFASLGLSSKKIQTIRKYFRRLWHYCNGNTYTELLAELPYSLRADITMKIYGSNIKSSRILGRLDDTIIRQLSTRVKHEFYIPGAHIVRTGDVCHNVFFIKKGEVVIMDENANLDICVDVLYENECFGEVKALLPKEQFRFSYVARLETEVGVIHRSDLEDILSRHQGLMEDLLSRATKIKDQRLALKDEEERIGVRSLDSDIDVDPDNEF